MIDLILILVILTIITSAILYIRKAKKKGIKCVGCSEGGNCTKCE